MDSAEIGLLILSTNPIFIRRGELEKSWGTSMKIPLSKGGWQPWLPGGCPSIERTGQVGTETPPTGLKALAPLAGGNCCHFHRPW